MAATSSSASGPTSSSPSRQARLIINDAFTRLQHSVSHDDAQEFQKTTLRDVRQAAVEVEERLAARQNMRNMRRFETFLNGIEQYSKVLEVLCNGTPYLSWIWAPIKLMVQLSSEYLASFEKLMDAYSQIAETIPRCDRLRTAFKDDKGFQELIALYYADILDFHRRAYKFFCARGWIRFFDSTWGRFDSRFKRILSNLAQHAELIEKEANVIDIVESKALRERLNDELSEREQESAMLQRSAIISWLDMNGIPKQEDELDRLLCQRHPGSCDWLLENEKVKTWICSDQSQQFIWIHGKPGAGKSVLCSNLIQHLQQEKVPVLHFFCTYRSANSRKSVDVLKSFAAQAISMSPDLVPFVVDTYVCKSLTSSLKQLRALLPQLLAGMTPGRITLDGLDECEMAEQAKILEEVCTIVRTAGGGWKALISSQEIPNITRSFSKIAHNAKVSLSEENGSVNAAIEAFVDRKIQTLNNDAPYLWGQADFVQSMKREMNDKANGMFLWVRLVLTSMEDIYSLKQLQEAILTLPSDLTKLYDRIFDDIRRRLGDLCFNEALCMFRFVLHACRPLKKRELLDGVVLQNDVLDDTTKLPPEAFSICKPLIETGPGDTLVLVHFSLQQYLLGRTDMSSCGAQHDVALACTKIVTSALDLVDPAQSQGQKLVNTGKGYFSFLPYAHTFWLDHLLSFAALGGLLSEETDWRLYQHLETFLAKHNQLSFLIPDATRCDSPDQYLATSQGLPDDRLQFLDGSLEVRSLVSKLIEFRKTSEKRSDNEAQKDPTLMTQMISEFEKATQALKSADSVPGLPQSLLDAFKRSHSSPNFLCRYQGCAADSGTFSTDSARNGHENLAHVKRIPCRDASCPWSSIGFRTLPDLRHHMRNFHSGARPSIVSPQVRRLNAGLKPSLPRSQHLRLAHTQVEIQGPGQPISEADPHIDNALKNFDFDTFFSSDQDGSAVSTFDQLFLGS